DRDYFKQYEPVWLLQNTTTWQQLAIWIDIGADDRQWGDAVRDFRALLVRLDVPHEFQNSWRGIHDSNYWSEHLSDYLIWYSSKLAGQ
ncbi:MAG: hypothetical protein AB1817_06175, partial [Chloroflexota bacterium]